MIKGPFFKIILILFFLSQAAQAQGPVIVIDPGHGGKDPGSVAHRGVPEKKLVLSLAKKLKKSLQKKAGATVFLTRERDASLSLEKRNQIANAKKCDLFISLHANSAGNRKAEGMELYYLNKATDAASRRLAERENRGTKRRQKDVEAIMSDLIQTAVTEESSELAAHLRKSLSTRLRKEGVSEVRVKTALFYVLVGAKCPSLLVETGYLTNPKEARRLKNSKFQDRFSDAMAEAIQSYWARQGTARSNL